MENSDDLLARNIFFYDKNGNTLYKRDNIIYIVNDKKLQDELRDIEGYRVYLPYRTLRIIIFFPAMLISAIISFIIYKVAGEETYNKVGALVCIATFIAVYYSVIYTYNKKVNEVLKKCEVLNKKDYE